MDPERVDIVNNRKSPIVDVELEEFLRSNDRNLTTTLEPELAYTGANYAIKATLTNYDMKAN